jgi:alpha-ketoglutarate-dependent taurine dioxygenase
LKAGKMAEPKIHEFEVENLSDLSGTGLEQVFDLFSTHGCVKLTQKRPVSQLEISPALSNLGRHFGSPVRHKLSDAAGVHPIRSLPGFPQYANTTSSDLLLHTDGSFEKNPPKMMMIYCETPAEQGGLSRICFAEDVYEFLKQNHSETLVELFRPDAFMIKRDDREALRSVFEVRDGRISMAFRYGTDVSLQIHPLARAGIAAIIEFVSDPANYAEFLLDEGQLLLMDNTRVLHGRTVFSPGSHRILHGLWCDGSGADPDKIKFGFVPKRREHQQDARGMKHLRA